MHVFFWVTKLGASEPGVMTVSSLGDPKSLADGSCQIADKPSILSLKLKGTTPKLPEGLIQPLLLGVMIAGECP